GAAIWPEALGPYHRTSTSQPALTDQALWNEYGLKESESAKYENEYENGTDAFTATAYRLQDSTGALAAYDWQRPATAKSATAIPGRAVETAKDLMLLHGNYVLSFQGYKPSSAELQPLFDGLKNVDGTPLPTLEGFLPSADRNPNSERYVIGPVGL